jgi:putative FmdB family regulatory protein
MPIYEYRRPDGTTFELVQSFNDPPLERDPDTGAPVERVLHAPAVHFKGSGFYNTDYGTRKRQRENAAAADGESKASKDSAADGSPKGSDGPQGGGDGKPSGESKGAGDGKGGGAGKSVAEQASTNGAKPKAAKAVPGKS